MAPRVLVSDKLSETAVQIFRDRGVEVDYLPDLGKDKEALLARWLIYPQDVAPVLGPMAAQAWGMHVQGESPDAIVREYDYRVEAGSARKPNVATRIENITSAMQILAPIETREYTEETTLELVRRVRDLIEPLVQVD